jgi:Ca-activated chloride channel family protein
MKITDDDIKKSFEQMEIPEPSESARKRALQEAMDEFAKKSVLVEKKSKGFAGLFRQMGKTLFKIITLKGEPIMTQRQFATVGILVITVGLIVSIGPQMFYTSKTSVDLQVPQPKTRQVQPRVDADLKQVPGKQKGNESATATVKPVETRDVGEAESVPEEGARLLVADQVLKEEMYRAAPSSAAPVKTDFSRMTSLNAPGEKKTGRVMRKRAYESDSAIYMPPQGYYKDEGRDKFTEITANSIHLVGEEPVSTFSIDVDTASYAFVRRQLNNGLLPQKDAVRVEELINYFEYDYPVPRDRDQPFKPSVAVYPTPWNDNTRLLHIGIKGYDILPAEKPRTNLVFLLDVSGSMNSPDKLPLLKNSFSMLVDSLGPEDTVAIVVYAGAAGTVLEPTKVKEKSKILASLDKLRAGGSTAGGAGIRLAYSLAEMNFDKEAVNRVILATDGDFNVGITWLTRLVPPFLPLPRMSKSRSNLIRIGCMTIA